MGARLGKLARSSKVSDGTGSLAALSGGGEGADARGGGSGCAWVGAWGGETELPLRQGLGFLAGEGDAEVLPKNGRM